MDRPYIFCHMLTSLDGKIMGNYMTTPEGERAAREFYDIAFGKRPFYRHQGWLSGRVTTDDNFTFYEKPALDENAPAVPEGDFVARRSDMYYVSVDFSGRLGWKSHVLTYEDTTAEVVEVLGAGASNAYKAFMEVTPRRDFDEIKEELRLILERYFDLFGDANNKSYDEEKEDKYEANIEKYNYEYNYAFIGKNDRIFPPENMEMNFCDLIDCHPVLTDNAHYDESMFRFLLQDMWEMTASEFRYHVKTINIE